MSSKFPFSKLPNDPAAIELLNSTPTRPPYRENGRLVAGWPTKPQPLRKWCVGRCLSITLDIILLCLALLFGAFGIAVKRGEGSSVATNFFTALRRAATLAPTVYPILFAAITGRALKAIALWRLECGARIGFLDQLVGSTSITTTIATQFKLRALNVLTVALLIVWALSPLGSQGSIRILGTALAETTTSKNMNYLNISSNAFTKYGTGDASGLFTQINALFAASLSSPASTKASDTDTWGNVKIPILETMDGTSIDDDGWMTPHVDNTSYASLIGLPFSAVPGETKTSFSIETNYWYLNCSSLRSIPNLTPCSGGNNSLTSTVRTGEIHAMELLSEARESNPVTISPNDYRHLVYCGWDNYSNGPGATGANCAMANSYVELQIACDGQACLVSRIRRSRTKQPPPSWTQLDAEVPGFAWFAVPLGYLMQPDDPFNTSSIRPVHDLNPQVFALRLSQLLNTFWFSMLGANSIQGGMNNHDLYATALSSGAQIESSAATSQRSYQVISCDDDWLTVLLLSVIVLVVLNMLGITATILCTGPDLGFNISSMAKDNEYMMTPHGGSTLDASDRARLLRDRRVKYGDVAGGGRVGYIAIATTEGSSYPSPLIRMRLYE